MSCTNEKPETTDNTPSEETPSSLSVTTVSEDFIKYVVGIDSISDTEYSVLIDKSIPREILPKIGTIVVIPQCPIAEFGFAGIIKKIIHNDNIEITTENPSLDQLSEEFDLTDSDFEFNIYDIQDDDGKALDYTLENLDSRSSNTFENLIIRFPFNIKFPDYDNYEIAGDAYMGFKKFSVNLLKEYDKQLVSTFEIEPSIGVNIKSTIQVKAKRKLSKRIGQLRSYLRATIPPGIPIIMPVTFYVYAEIDLNGEISTSFSVNPHFDGKYRISSESGKWECSNESKSTNQESPWVFSSFDVKGEFGLNLRCGVIIGLYSASSGIGLNIIPRYSISAEASLSSNDLLKLNPIVTNNISVNSEAYCIASFFGKELAKGTMSFPSTTLWEEKMTLFPEITGLSAQTVDKTSGLISYKRNKHYFLENFPITEGLSLFINNSDNHLDDYHGNDVNEDEEYLYKEQYITNLKGNTTYYVCPYIEIFNKKYYGVFKSFTTDENIEKRTYRFSILSCEYAKLIPPQTTYTLDVFVDDNGKIIKVCDPGNPEGYDFTKHWEFQNKRVDQGSRSDVVTERLDLSFSNYGESHDCINTNHNHSQDENGVMISISYEYKNWYGYNIDQPHQVYMLIHNWRNMEFHTNLKSSMISPCWGWYYLLEDNSIHWKVHDAIIKIERLE
jgi:hypothetical protein